MEKVQMHAADLLGFHSKRQVTLLFKEYLSLLQKLAEEHQESLDKLRSNLPKEYQAHVNLADHFTPQKFERIRKEVLGRGNDTIRNIEEEFKKYRIDFYKE